MNRASMELVSAVLRGGPAPNATANEALNVLDEWVVRHAPSLDADLDGSNDDAGVVIMDMLSFVDKDLRTLLDPASVEGPFFVVRTTNRSKFQQVIEFTNLD